MAKRIAPEVLTDLKRRMEILPARSPHRRTLVREAAMLYDISEATIYRLLKEYRVPKALRRSDSGVPRSLLKQDMEYCCEIIAALKMRTMNKNGRHISTGNAIALLEECGVDTPSGFCKPEKGVLKKTTINRYLREWGLDHARMLRCSPAVRFQAKYSNECWHFDLSPSDLKHVKEPLWYDPAKGKPILMLYSVVDDRSGVCYQEYRNVYGEDVEGALRFLFNAMSTKDDLSCPFQGVPEMIYMDNGPIARSALFQRVMGYLDIAVKTHMPDSADPHRKTARAKGKVERAFRTTKEAHEVLYHLREPKNEVEANQRLLYFLGTYNDRPHRSEPHSRMEDWLKNLPAGGYRAMCDWERYAAFAREPEKRLVGVDARITVEGAIYEVSAELAGERVILWWGLFDTELYVEHGDKRYGPYIPVEGAIPLHRYRKFRKTQNEQKQEQIEKLAASLTLPEGNKHYHAEILPFPADRAAQIASRPFDDPDPFDEFSYLNPIQAKLAIADYLGKPLALFPQEHKDWINELLAETLNKQEIRRRIKEYFNANQGNVHVTG